MKRTATAIILTLLALTAATAKTTYIPAYMSYIQIADRGDTISQTSVGRELAATAADGTFRISIHHEDLTGEHIKAIKRAKRAADWLAASAVLQSVSAAFSNNALQYFISSNSARVTAELAGMYAGLARAEQTLDVEVWIENETDGEMAVSDLERGLTWYIQPREAMALAVHNPDLLRLRISDTDHQHVRFATVAAGSSVDKAEMKHEDADYWFITAYERQTDGTLQPLGGFEQINKHDYTRRLINYRQLQEYLGK